MEKFASNTHSFSLAEVLVLVLAIIFIVFVGWPKLLKFTSKIKMDNAVDNVYSYKDSVSKFYVSRLMVDSNFILNGRYTISDGNLVDDEVVYNLLVAGNVPSDGYLDYENNILRDGCILIDGYFVLVVDGEVSSVSKNDCMIHDDVEEIFDVALGEI